MNLSLRLRTVYELAKAWSKAQSASVPQLPSQPQTAAETAARRRRRLIDVGSDHGYLSLFALEKEYFDYVIATDIHADPASKTRQLLAEHGLAERSEVHVADGLKGVHLLPGDTVVMAGMGGNTMMSIISNCLAETSHDVLRTVTFCLQPQKTAPELRAFLYENGFVIEDEAVAVERGLYYVIMAVRYMGEEASREIDPIEMYYGPSIMLKAQRGIPEIEDYVAYLDAGYEMKRRGNEQIDKMLRQKSIGGYRNE